MVYAMLMGETYLYQITIESELDARWPEWFDGVDITKQAGPGGIPVTMHCGVVAHQPALRGILPRI